MRLVDFSTRGAAVILKCHLLFGVPCCERLLPQRIHSLVVRSSKVALARNVIHADRFVIVGQMTHKQVQLLQYLWQQAPYPAKLVHLKGCSGAHLGYALADHDSPVLKPDFVSERCDLDAALFDAALQGLI